MNSDPHTNPEVPRAGGVKEKPVARLSDGRVGPDVFSARVCYGVTVSGKIPAIVRSCRVAWGRVRHTLVTAADAAVWQQWLLDQAQPGALIAGCALVQESLTLWLQAPFASIPKAEKVLPALLDVQLPFPLESCHYALADIRRMADGSTHALAVVARIESLRARLEAYREQRLDPVLLDHEGLALWTQSREEHPLPPDAWRVILHVDLDRVTLVIGRGERYGNAHSVQVNLAAPAEGADFHAIRAGLIGRLQRILRAELQAEARVSWLACGAGARNGALLAGLHQDLAGEWPGALAIHQDPESFLARALGTRALTRGPLRCNLRAHELAHPTLVRQIRRRALTTASLFLVAGLFLCGLNLAWLLLAKQREAGIRQSISSLAAELAPGATIPHGQEVREARKAAAQRAEREAPFLNAFEPSLAGALAELIREGKSQEVAYETLTLQRNGFVLSGISDDWDRCARLANRLRTLGYGVKLERQEAVMEAQVRFTIKGDVVLKPFLRTRQSVSLHDTINGRWKDDGGARFVAIMPFWNFEMALGERPLR